MAKVGAREFAIGLFVLMFLLNGLAVKTLEYPVVYCTVQPYAKAVFGPWISLLGFAMMVVFLVNITKRDFLGAFGAFFLTILIFGIPEYADLLFRLGGECVWSSPPSQTVAESYGMMVSI